MYVNTSRGLARIDGEELALLALPFADVSEALRHCGLDGLRRAEVTERCDRRAVQITSAFGRARTVVVVGNNHVIDPSARAERRSADPIIVIVPGSAVTGPGCPVQLSAHAGSQVIPEGEVALVIGAEGRDLTAANAWDHVAGLTLVNDLTAVDLMKRAFGDPLFGTALGKSFAGFKPVGPGLWDRDGTTADYDIEVVTRINGEVVMAGRTSGYVHSPSEVIAFASRYVTLEPGDLICMGAPQADPQRLASVRLVPGDIVDVSAPELGVLQTAIVAPCLS